MKQQGFTLIECLISMTLFTLIALLVTAVTLQSYRSLQTLRNRANTSMMYNAALDLLLYDLKRAPTMKSWLTNNKTSEYAWKQGTDSIKWYVKDATLLRSNGKRASVVTLNISSLKITEMKDTFVVSLSCADSSKLNNFEQSVRAIR